MPLPDNVVELLKSKHFLHLATCHNNVPHVSLMNYVYHQEDGTHYIIMSTPKDTTKYKNLAANPRVSLLVHDWITSSHSDSEHRNSLYAQLQNLNKAETSSMSAMLDGQAATVEPGNDKYGGYRELLLQSGFCDEKQAHNYLDCDGTALVVITVTECKVTDVNDLVQSY